MNFIYGILRLFLICIILSVLLVTFNISFGQNIDSLKQIINSGASDSLRITALISYSKAIIHDKPDSALIMLTDAETIASKQEIEYLLASVYHEKAFLFLQVGNNAESLNQLYKAKKITDSFSEASLNKNKILIYIRVLNGIGMVNYEMEEYDKAIGYFQEGVDYLEKQNSIFSEKDKNRYLFHFYNNIGGVYLKIEKFTRADYYLNKAIGLIDLDNNVRLYVNILNNLSIASREMGDLIEARQYVDMAMDICLKKGFEKELASSYNNKGSCCVEAGNISEASDNFVHAFELSKKNGYSSSGTVALINLSEIYRDMNQFEQAYMYSTMLLQWKDSLRSEDRIRKFSEIEMKQKLNAQLYENKLRQNQIGIAQKNRELVFIFITVASLMLLSIIVLLYFLQAGRLQQNKLEAEKNKLLKQTLEVEKKKIEEELEVKKKEMATNVLYSIRRNEMISKLVLNLKAAKLSFKKENWKIIDNIIIELESTAVDEVWKEFEVRFQQVHTSFYDKLNKQFPSISINEKRLCAFLRLNMTTKEISVITNQSVNSISVARTRLRKKLDLDHDDNLISFLEKIELSY